MERTDNPVVFIHGFMEWGLKTPLFGLCPSFWPVDALNRVNSNHIIVDVGKASSDHDRATEVFYQLMGGQVDYGEEHSAKHGHLRFGETYPMDKAFHPNWSEENPVHLVGHSFGATTSIELYQMLCKDAFGVGSNYKWVKSITSISGPLTGSTICNILGARLDTHIPTLSGGHLVVGTVTALWKLQNFTFPWLKRIYDLNMAQWRNHESWKMVYSTDNPFHNSRDMVLYDLLPARRVQRNSELVHMDKVYLFSIVATPKDPLTIPVMEWSLASFVLWLLIRRKSLVHNRKLRYTLCVLVVYMTWRKFCQWDLSKLRMSFWGLTWLIRNHAQKIQPQELYSGVDKEQWEHSDGVVNTYSQIRPRVEVKESMSRSESCISHISIDLKNDDNDGMMRGQWHTYRVDKNHLSGTNWDKEAEDLYRNLFKLLNNLHQQPAPSY